MKTKFVLVTLRVQNGEYQYYCKSVHEVSTRKKTNKVSKDHAKEFYLNFSYTDDSTHYFNGG